MANKAVKRKPYTIKVIFEESRDFFSEPLVGKPNFTQRLGYWVSEMVFKYLILKAGMRLYVSLLAILAIIMFVLAFISQLFGVVNTTVINYAYMCLMLLVLPFIAYFLDVYQAMQLRLGMNIAVREESYPKRKRGEPKRQNYRKFEWVPTSFAILNAIMHGKKKQLSYGELGEIAGVDRQTVASIVRKLLSSGLIYKENEIYYFSDVKFEVSVRKGKKTEPRQLSEEEKKRLRYLFEVMCFVAF